MSNYAGWNMLSKVALVKAKGSNYTSVIDPSDKKALESAKSQKSPDLVIKIVDNKGFKVKILESADKRMSGGRYSTWKCLIEKDNEEYIVSIDSDLLLELILQSDFSKGTCDKEVSFAKKKNNLGLLHSEMKEYQEAMKDTAIRKNVSTKKTKKWQLGHNYITLQNNDIYLGKLYNPIKIESKYEPIPSEVRKKCSKYGTSVTSLININIDKNRQSHLTISEVNLKRIINNNTPDVDITLKSFIDAVKNNIEKRHSNLSNCWTSAIYRTAHINLLNTIDTLPSRREGDIQLQEYNEYYDDLDNLLSLYKQYVLEEMTDNEMIPSITKLGEIIRSVDGHLTDVDIDIISKIICNNKHDSNLFKLTITPDKKGEEPTVEYLYTYTQLSTRLQEYLGITLNL